MWAALGASAVIAAAVIALPQTAHGQQRIAPQWVNDTWRSANYPQNVWFVGFSQDGLKQGASTAAAIQRVEQDARNKLSENISSRLTSASQNETFSSRVTSEAQSKETVEKNYGQIIQLSTSAAVAGTELYSYHDTENNRVYAFTAVKKSALANYYAGMIESGLADAERNLDLAKQAAELGKKKDAVDKLAEAKSKIESLGYYRDLLIATDSDNGAELGQGDRANRLLKTIAAAQITAEDIMPVFVTGKETILNAPADIIVPGLQTLLNDNDCRIAESEKGAGYILKIEARACNAQYDKRFYHSESCVKITLTNVKTGKVEVSVANLTGPKKSGKDAHEAAEAAFREVVPKIWEKVSGKITGIR
jgi:hypothetical protein